LESILKFFSVDTVMFTLLNYPMSYLELIGTVFGIWCVWLTVKERISCWPIGIINILLFMALFFQVKLYADMSEQFVFFILSIYGWWVWTHPVKGKEEVQVTKLTLFQRYRDAIIVTLLTFTIGFLLDTRTDASLPYWDTATTIISLYAQYIMAKKKLECWYCWITIDIMGLFIYSSKGLYMVTALYAVYLVLATIGWLKWRKSYVEGISYRKVHASSSGTSIPY
jgi:nicotinamide mononucleotide transporter